MESVIRNSVGKTLSAINEVLSGGIYVLCMYLSHCIIIMLVWYCIMCNCKVYMLNVQILIIMNDVSDSVIVLGKN